jgi:hypothetical protein
MARPVYAVNIVSLFTNSERFGKVVSSPDSYWVSFDFTLLSADQLSQKWHLGLFSLPTGDFIILIFSTTTFLYIVSNASFITHPDVESV